MYKLTEKEYKEKMIKFKETFIYSKNNNKKTILIILLLIFAYILFNGLMAFAYLLFYENNNSELLNNTEILDIIITIVSAFLTIGIIGTIISSLKIIALSKENSLLFKEFVEKK